MPGTYVVKHSDSTVNAIEIPPLTQDTSTSLTFVGYRSPVYGEALWTNMLHMLENFAAPAVTPTAERPEGGPRNPIIGQIWVDTTTSPGVPKVFNKQGKWEVIGAGLTISTDTPPNQGVIDPLYPPNLWFNPANNALFYWNGSNWSGINCTLVASQIEYNALVDMLTAAIVASGVISPTIPTKVTTTAGSTNSPPDSTKWASILSVYRDLCQAIRDRNINAGVSTADNQFWVDACVTLNQAVTDGENFIWCPADSTSGLRGMSSYVTILDTMKSASISAATWAAVKNLAAAGAVDFTMSSPTVVPGQSITFAPTSLAVTDATSWLWDFGNGVMSSDKNPPAIAYPNPGVYTVSLTASNSKSTATVTHQLTSYITPVSSFNVVGSIIGLPPLVATLIDNSQNNPTSWSWTVTNIVTGATVTTSTSQNFQYTFTTNGVFRVTLVASNQAGESLNVATAQVITADTPVASFTYSPSAPVNQAPLTVQFTDTSTNGPTSWLWTFGDGATSTEQHPSHTYATSGVFSVGLTATNIVGSGATSISNCIATAIKPVTNFSYSGATGAPPMNVVFTDLSTNYPTAWQWDFGDGTTSTLQNPTHTYTGAATAVTYTTPGTFSYTVPANVTSLSYTYLTSNGDVTTTLAVSPGQVIPIVIGAAGAVSSIGTTTLPAYNKNIATFGGVVDGILTQKWSTNTSNAATYSGGPSTRDALTAGALAVGLTYQEIAEGNWGDLGATITMNSTRASTLFTNPVAYFSAASGRGSFRIDSQPTAANGFVATTSCDDWIYADGVWYSFTLAVKHVTALKINAAAYQFNVSLTSSNLAGSNTKTVNNLVNTSFSATIVLSSNEQDVNIRNKLLALGWNGVVPVMGTLTVNTGVTIGASSASVYAMRTGGSFPTGSDFAIINRGYIVGKGGSAPSGAGGPALLIDATTAKVSVHNYGTIGGGGGGGGSGGGGYYEYSGIGGWYSMGGGGGGGAGYSAGVGSGTAGSGTGPYANYHGASGGGTGSTTAGGAGGTGSYGHAGWVAPNTYSAGGAGGAGGGLGAAGGGGGSAIWAGEDYGSGAVGSGSNGMWTATANAPAPTGGGAGGACITGNAGITWVVTGTRLGTIL